MGITTEQLLAAGWVEVKDNHVIKWQKDIRAHDVMSEDLKISLVLHWLYNELTFGVMLTNGSMLNFTPQSIEDILVLERILDTYDDFQ